MGSKTQLVAELEPDSEDDEKMPGLACMSDNSSHPRQCFFCDFLLKNKNKIDREIHFDFLKSKIGCVSFIWQYFSHLLGILSKITVLFWNNFQV